MIKTVQIRRNGAIAASLRVCIVLLAIAALLGVATGSNSPAHRHAKAPAGGCEICFAAHVASFEAKAFRAILHAPQVVGRIALCPAVSCYRLFYRSSFLTRGPPSISL